MGKYLKSTWSFLSGKKTTISSLAGVTLSWLQATGKLDGATSLYLAMALSAVTGVAVGHKVVKATHSNQQGDDQNGQ